MDRPKKKWGTCRVNSGQYELLEPVRRKREERFRRIKKDAGQLAIQGMALKLRKPRRGECPQGPNGEDDPRFDARALLAAIQTPDQTQGAKGEAAATTTNPLAVEDDDKEDDAESDAA